jgi:hypothetical protein
MRDEDRVGEMERDCKERVPPPRKGCDGPGWERRTRLIRLSTSAEYPVPRLIEVTTIRTRADLWARAAESRSAEWNPVFYGDLVYAERYLG